MKIMNNRFHIFVDFFLLLFGFQIRQPFSQNKFTIERQSNIIEN